MTLYLKAILRPLAMLLVAAIVMHASTNGVIPLLFVPIAQLFASAWAGSLLVCNLNMSRCAASFSGPLLLFIEIFIFGYLPALAIGRLSSIPEAVPSNLIAGSMEVTYLVGLVIVYSVLFPFSLGAAGIGAYLGGRERTSVGTNEGSNVL